MKNFLVLILSFSVCFTLLFSFSSSGQAQINGNNLLERKGDKLSPNKKGKKDKGTTNATSETDKKKNQVELNDLEVVSNDGNTNVYGSILDPNVNQILLYLPRPLLSLIKKTSLKRLSLSITSTLDSTKTYNIQPNASNIQRKKINGSAKGRLYLVTNLYNLTTPSGVTVPPSSLPSGEYRLKITSDEFDAITKTFRYHTPALVVGVVKSEGTGFVNVEDLDGNILSDKTVAISPNGTFLTEVRANKLKDNVQIRKALKKKTTDIKDQADDEEDVSEELLEEPKDSEDISSTAIDTGVVHAVTNQELYAITPLSNDAEKNSIKANKPIEVSKSSTLVANIGKKYKALAQEVAKEELEILESGGTKGSFEDFGCDIFQFVERCDFSNEEELASIGADFKEFTQTANCTFPEFGLIKTIVALAPEEANSFIGRGYCENISSIQEDKNKPCERYFDILDNFKKGLITQLPCPPSFCTHFSDIKPPKCVEAKDFCEEEELVSQPLDLTCRGKKCIGGIPACVTKPIIDPFCKRVGIDISKEDCINFSKLSNDLSNWQVATSIDGQEFCVPEFFSQEELEKTLEECSVTICHKECEETLGTSGKANFTPSEISFGNENCEVCKCHISCDLEAGRILDCTNPRSQFFSNKCCEKQIIGPGFAFQSSPFSFTPEGFGKGQGPIPQDIYSCICEDPTHFNEKGFVNQDAIDFCVTECPAGYEKDPNKDLCLPICSEGLVRDQNGFCKRKCPSGTCESSECPDYCQRFTNTGQVPPECAKCFSSSCPPGFTQDFNTGNCIETKCGVNQYFDSNSGVCRCNNNGQVATSLGPEGCAGGSFCSSNMIPNPNLGPNQASCICPPGLPFWETLGGFGKCVDVCSDGRRPFENQTGLLANSPIHCSSSSSCPSATPVKCSDGSCAVSAASCQFSCPSPYIKDPNNSSYCICPSSTPFEHSGTCVTACPAGFVASTEPGTITCPTCSPRQVCKCSDGTYPIDGACTANTGSVTLTSAVISGTNLAVTFSTSFPDDGSCAYLQDSAGVTLYSLFCGSTTGTTVNAPISSFPHTVAVGDKVKICKSNASTICSSLVSITGSVTCTSPKVLDTATNTCKCPSGQVENTTTGICEAEQVTLHSIEINSGKVNVTYSKNFITCAYPKDASNNILHTQNHFCTVGSNIFSSTPQSSFNATLQSGIQVKLCHGNNGNLCSPLVTVSSGTVPTAPSALVASLSSGNVILNWTDNSNDETEFKISRRPSGSDTWSTIATVGTGITSYTDTGLAAGTYDYHVNACNANGCSTDSNIASVNVPNPITLNSITIKNGANLEVNFSKSGFSECVLLVNANDNTILHNGVASYNLLCSQGTLTNSLGSFLTTPEQQVKLCKANATVDPTGLASPLLCSLPVTIGDTNSITLNSAVLSGGNLTINYNKNFSDCVGLRDPNNNNNKVTSQNQYCGTSGTETIPTTSLVGGYNTSLQAGNQVKLCLTASGLVQTCSQTVTVTSN